MAIDIQQGDVKLFQTVDDGEISVENGIVAMSGGLDTMAYLCLFGGNYQDAGSADKTKSWWGNSIEDLPARMVRSETQYLLETLPAIPASLLPLRDAAVRDLNVFLTEKIASEVTVVVSMPGVNRVHFDIAINAFGELHEFEFTENWELRAERKQKATNQVWRDGTTDAIVAIYDAGNYPIDDYGYPCFNGVLHAAYAAELSGIAANNLPWRRQCNDGELPYPPTSLVDLRGWPLNDFDSSACATIAVNDFNWIAKKYGIIGNTGAMVGGKYRIAQSGNTQSIVFYDLNLNLSAGAHETTVERIIVSDFVSAVGLVANVGAFQYGCHHVGAGGGLYNLVVTKDGAAKFVIASTSLATFTGRITWDGADVRCYLDGVLRFTEANNGSSGLIVPVDVNPTGSTGAITADFSDTSVRDAASGGNLIHRSIVGTECSVIGPAIFGGFPDETTTDVIFGGSPDQVYILDGYFGGNP